MSSKFDEYASWLTLISFPPFFSSNKHTDMHTNLYRDFFYVFLKENLRPDRQEVLDTARQHLPFLWFATVKNTQLKLDF